MSLCARIVRCSPAVRYKLRCRMVPSCLTCPAAMYQQHPYTCRFRARCKKIEACTSGKHAGLGWTCHYLPSAVLPAKISTRRSCSAAADPQEELEQTVAAPPQQSTRISDEQIRENIRRTMERRSRPLDWCCPACSTHLATQSNLQQHVDRCCRDLFNMQALKQAVGQPELNSALLSRLVREATELQGVMQRRALEVAFLSGVDDETRQPIKHGPDIVASQLGLPPRRARQLLKSAMKAIPLVVDDDPVDVVYEDEDFIALNKPPGVNSQPIHRWQGGSMVNRVIGYLGHPPFGLHRLDQNTSGLLLMAKNPKVVPGVHEQFRQRTLQKSYLCIAMGSPQQPHFSVEAPIGYHPQVSIARSVVPADTPDARSSLTHFSVLGSVACGLRAEGVAGMLLSEFDVEDGREERWSGACLVEARPATGRTHQIRVHMAYAGHPLVGDEVYGLQGPWIPRQALHAYSLELKHPLSGKSMQFVAPLPADLEEALNSLGITVPEHIIDTNRKRPNPREVHNP